MNGLVLSRFLGMALAIGGVGAASTGDCEEIAATAEVTSGALTPSGPGRFRTRSGNFRANFAGAKRRHVGLRFKYRGPSQGMIPLASGEERRQIGLKLRAADSCNLIYVMWHLAPSHEIEVSVKHNPGQSRHEECRDHGYRFIRPSWQWDQLRPIEPGEQRDLRASLRGRQLKVWTDGRLAWRGTLPEEIFQFDGPAGVRSDNGEFEIEPELDLPAEAIRGEAQ